MDQKQKTRTSVINLNWFTVGIPLLAIVLVIILTTRTDKITRLMVASETDHTNVVEKLLSSGVNPNAVNGTNSALITAIRYRQFAVAGLLLSRGADPNFDAGSGYTPLTWAVRMDDPEIVKILIQFGGNPHQVNVNGKTAADEARNFPDLLQLLSQPKNEPGNGNDHQ